MRAETTSESLHVDVSVTRDAFSVEARFDAPPGVTILFGPSGSGKSTILSAIAGLLVPARGRVALGGEVWFDSAAKIQRPVHVRGIAFVFQSLALFPHMSALDNVDYGMSRQTPAHERRERARAMLDRLRVAHLEKRKPATFSGGEAQRVALARAFAMKPKLVLLDEPFSSMDRELRSGLVEELRGFVSDVGVPMVHVTHHRGEARALGDRAVLVHAGRIVRAGSVTDVLGVRPAHSDEDDAIGLEKRGKNA